MFDAKKLEDLRADRDRWEETTLHQSIARLPERAERFTTISGRPVARVYTPLDIAAQDYRRDLGLPGEYPFTRGIHATGYRARPWTMRMFAGFGTAEETNARYRYLLEQGNMGLSVAFDLPTLMATTPTRPRRWASSASAAWRSAAGRTWAFCSTASRWARSAPR